MVDIINNLSVATSISGRSLTYIGINIYYETMFRANGTLHVPVKKSVIFIVREQYDI